MFELINMPRAAWRRQPQGSPPNPGWEVAWTPNRLEYNLLSSHSYRADSYGIALHNDNSISPGDGVSISQVLDPVWNFGTGAFTVVWYGYLSALLASGSAVAAGSRGAGNHWNLLFTSNGLAYQPRPGAVVGVSFDIPINKPVVVVCQRSGSQVSVAYRVGFEVYNQYTATDTNNYYLRVGGTSFRVSGYFVNTSSFEGGTYLLGMQRTDAPNIQRLVENPWQIFAPDPPRFYLIPSSGLSSVYQDGLIRWNLLSAAQQDSSLRWDVKVTVQNDILTRWNVLEGVLADTVLRWNSIAAIQQDTILRWDVVSALSAVQQDAALRWNLLTSAQQDIIARWNTLAEIQTDFTLRWHLLTTAQQDTILRWNTLTTAQQVVLLRWNALHSLENNQTLRWDVLSEILSAQNDVTLRWNTLSVVQQDALLRWNLVTAIEQALATRWNLLNAIEVSQSLRWNIAVAVANEITLSWNLVETLTASNNLNLSWNLLAVAENTIELRWHIGDSSVTPDVRIFLVRGEDRIFKVLSEDRIFGVN